MTFFRRVLMAGAWAAMLTVHTVAFAETTDTKSLAGDTTVTDVLADIPIGPADENDRTSAAVTRILVQSANAYASADAMMGRGMYVYVSKDEDQDTSYSSAKLTLNFLRPENKMAVVSESDDAYLDCAFYADGTTSTHMTKSDEAYVTLEQPESLAAYAEHYRAGEIYEEYSGALAFSVTGPVLISEDPQAWLFADVSRFVYEGKEEVNGAACYRIRFIQENPDMIVIVWVNDKTWLIDRTSFINSYDENDEMVESFEEGQTATMSIMTWESQTTSPEAVKPKAFEAKIPTGYEHRKDVKPPNADDDDGGEDFWGSLVGLAAKSSPEETTWSLVKVTGSLDVELERFAQVKPPLAEFDILPKAAGDEPSMAVVAEDGTVNYLRGDGSLDRTVKLEGPLGLVAMVTTETSDILFVTTDKADRTVTAFDMEGKKLWSYRHPFTEVDQLVSDMEPGSGIYVGFSGDSGVRKLNTKGEVIYATAKVNQHSMQVMPYEANRIVARNIEREYIMDRNLKLLQSFESEEWMAGTRWDGTGNSAYPLVCLAYTKDRDILLQRRSEKGEIAWTTIVEPKVERNRGTGFLWANLPVNGEIQKCAVILMAEGGLVILTNDGDTLYRGKLSGNAALVKQNNDRVVQRLTIADMNADGVDEIYTLMHDNLMRMQVVDNGVAATQAGQN